MSDDMKRRLADTGRFIKESISRILLGVDKLGNSHFINWIILGLVLLAGVGVKLFFEEQIEYTVTFRGRKRVGNTSVQFVIYIAIVLAWIITALVWTALKFRPSPSLALELHTPDVFNGEKHFRIKLNNISRNSLEQCEVRIIKANPDIGPHILLHCMGYQRPESGRVTIHGDSSEVFDIIGHHSGLPHFSWKGVVERQGQPINDYEITLEANGKGVDKVTKRLSLRRNGSSFEMVDLDS